MDTQQPKTVAGHGPLRIAVSGTHGAIGSALVPFLRTAGHVVDRLVRTRASEARDAAGGREIFWSAGGDGKGAKGEGQLDPAHLDGVDVVVHLAGSSVLGRTRRALAEFRESRVSGTRTIARAAASMKRRPPVLIVASGVGYYGDRGDESLTEAAGVGSGVFAEVARDWEAACEPARQAGVRVVNLRIGIMLSREAGALRAMLPTFRLGLGCVPGTGRQWWSWVSREDVLGAVLHAIAHEEIEGGLNVCAPGPVTAHEFCAAVARACDRSLFANAPAWVLRPVLGFATEGVLGSARMAPEKLRTSGFRFAWPELERALAWELGKGANERARERANEGEGARRV